jgi:hypothetical protein
MQDSDYPKKRWKEELLWAVRKSDWGQYMRTATVTAAIVIVTAFSSPSAQNESIPSSSSVTAPASTTTRNHFWDWRLWLSACAVLYLELVRKMRNFEKDRKIPREVPGAGGGKGGLFGDAALCNRFLPGGGHNDSFAFGRWGHAVLLGGLCQHLFLLQSRQHPQVVGQDLPVHRHFPMRKSFGP